MDYAPLVLDIEKIKKRIFELRNKYVMIDEDLAGIYGVKTKRLNEQVKRNIKRFPEEFMFQLTYFEFKHLKPQIATSSWRGKKKSSFCFY